MRASRVWRAKNKQQKEEKLIEDKSKEEKDRTIFKLKYQIEHLQQTLVDLEERERQYIKRSKEIDAREVESKDRQKHNRKLIAELQAEIHGK